MMTPDQSRALALYVNKHPQERPRVVSLGWNALAPAEKIEAAQMFEKAWSRPMDTTFPT